MLGKRRLRAAAAIALAVVALVLAALAVSGCGETVIDKAKIEAALEENLRKSSHERVSSVDCPSSVEVETGARFECAVKLAGGKEETAVLRIRDKNADVEVIGIAPKK